MFLMAYADSEEFVQTVHLGVFAIVDANIVVQLNAVLSYSRPSVARTVIARLPWLFRTRS